MTPSPRLLFFAVFLMAASAILYELLLAAVLSYLLGATVLYFSFTIGIFLFALGVGAWWSRQFEQNLLRRFLTIEAALGLLGGSAVPLVFAVYALLFRYLGSHVFNNLFSFLFQAGLAEILFNGFAFTVVFAIGVLVGTELPIFTRLVNESLMLKEALARVFFWDYAGALVASVLFPLLLLPLLGFLRTGFLIGLINLAAAAILARAVGGQAISRRFSRLGQMLLAAGLVILAAGFALAPYLDRLFTQAIFAGSEVLWDQTSPYQRIQLIKNQDGKVSLFLNGELQFQSGLLDTRYHETFVHPVMAFLGERARRILILGGGDGLLLREILRYPAVESVTMVDIDQQVTRLATMHPMMRALNADSMRDPRLTLVHDDAFHWLLERAGRGPEFDVAFLDFPDPIDDALSRLYAKEFYLLVKQEIGPGGLLVTQAGTLPSRFHESVKRTLKAAGYWTLSLHPVGPDPNLGIEGVFESSFVAAAPSVESIEAFYQSLHGDEAVADVISPYLNSNVLSKASTYTLFRLNRSFGFGGSLTQRLVEVQSIIRSPLTGFRAPPNVVRGQIQDLISYERFPLPTGYPQL